MMILITIVHVLVSALLVGAVLIQSGKGGGLAGSIGGGMANTSVLGGRTASNFLTKATTILATVFMLSCLFQSFLTDRGAAVPTSATERLLQERSAAPTPFTPAAESGEDGLLPGTVVEGENAPAAEGEAVPAPAGGAAE
jgi:preprotein translocase subunit SecG